jgi:peptidoglycan/LPS O-acetylase OafA/YrhL
VPIYWVATLAVFAVAVIAPAAVKTTTSGSVALIKSLLFIPFSKSGTSTFRPDLFVGWTLNYEMFFYLLFAIGLAYPRYVVGVRWVCVALGGLVIAGLVANPQGTNLLLFYSDSIVIEFALGMLIGLYLPRVTVSPSRLNKGLLLSLLVASLACVVVIPTLASGNIPRLFTMGVPATGVVGSALLLEQCGLVMTNPLVLLLGGASHAGSGVLCSMGGVPNHRTALIPPRAKVARSSPRDRVDSRTRPRSPPAPCGSRSDQDAWDG